MPWIKDGIEYTESQLRATHTNTAFQSPIPPAVAAEFGYTWQDPLPPEPHVEQPRRVLRDWEFRDRFSPAQLVGIMRAAMAGDDQAAFVWLALSTASDGVNLDKPEYQAGVQYLATAYPALGLDVAQVLA